MTIIQMTSDHVPHIAQLEKICFSDPWSESTIGSELNNVLSLWLVALDGDALIGYVGSQTVLGQTDMMNLAVHPDFRRRGVAEALVTALVGELQKKGSNSLMLEVRFSNESARKLYEKMGFFQVGRRPGYYRNPKEDALILRKEWGN